MNVEAYNEIINHFNSNNKKSVFIDWEDESINWDIEYPYWDNVRHEIEETNYVFRTVKIYNSHIERIIRGQMSKPSGPTCFVEIEEENVKQLGKQITASDLTIKFHILQTELDSSDGQLDQNLSIFSLRDTVKRWFSGFKLSKGGRFLWNNEDEEYRHINIYHYILSFRTYFIDLVSEIKWYPYNEGIEELTYWGYDDNGWTDETDNWENATHISGELKLNITT